MFLKEPNKIRLTDTRISKICYGVKKTYSINIPDGVLKKKAQTVCDETFVDLRGFTSHARHAHDLSKEEIYDLYFMKEKDEKDNFWKILIGAGGIILTIISFGRVK